MAEPARDETASDTSRTAIYLNKRAVARLDLPLAHTLAAHNDGWRMDFAEAGRLRLTMREGHNDFVDVTPGDYLLCTGEDLYLSQQRARSAAEEQRAAKEERSQRKQQARAERAAAKPEKGARPEKEARPEKGARPAKPAKAASARSARTAR